MCDIHIGWYAKSNLFTSRWSPMRRVFSIDPVGILNAWSTNVVPKIARITVTTNDSKVSRVDDFLYSSANDIQFLPQPIEERLCSLLLGGLFTSAPAARGQVFARGHFHREHLLVLRPHFIHDPIIGRGQSLRLHVFLQRGLVID